MTEEPTEMDEAKLRMLLEQGEQPVAPSREQLDRIRDHLGPALGAERRGAGIFDPTLGQDSDTTQPELLELVFGDSGPRASGRPLLATAAILTFVVLVGLAVLASLRGSDVVSVADSKVTPPPGAAPACPAVVAEFLEGIDLWGGVENWSFVTDASAPEPDLLTLAIWVVELEVVAAELANSDLAERLQSIRETPIDSRLRPVDREERLEAVLAAQVALEMAASNNPQLSNCSGGDR